MRSWWVHRDSSAARTGNSPGWAAPHWPFKGIREAAEWSLTKGQWRNKVTQGIKAWWDSMTMGVVALAPYTPWTSSLPNLAPARCFLSVLVICSSSGLKSLEHLNWHPHRAMDPTFRYVGCLSQPGLHFFASISTFWGDVRSLWHFIVNSIVLQQGEIFLHFVPQSLKSNWFLLIPQPDRLPY